MNRRRRLEKKSLRQKSPQTPKNKKRLLTEEKARAFAEILLESIFEPSVDLQRETQIAIVSEYGNILKDPIAEDSPIRETKEWSSYRNWLMQHYGELIESGRLFLAVRGDEETKNEEAVGTVGFELRGKRDGKNVYEVSHLVVQKDARSSGAPAMLINALRRHLTEFDPSGLILSHSKNVNVNKAMSGNKSIPVSPAEYVAIEGLTGMDAEQSVARRLTKEQLGWRISLRKIVDV